MRTVRQLALALGYLLLPIFGSAAAEPCYWFGSADDPVDSPEFYYANRYSPLVPLGRLPKTGETVRICSDLTYHVTDATAAFVSGLGKLAPENRSTVIFDFSTNVTMKTSVNLYNDFYVRKTGVGDLELTNVFEPDSMNRHFEYYGRWSVEEGRVIFPQSAERFNYAGFLFELTVAEGAEAVLPNFYRLYVTHGLHGAGRIVYTNELASQALYVNGDKGDDPPFEGVLSGCLKYQPSMDSALLSLTNDFTNGVYLLGGALSFRRLGSEGVGLRSSLGKGDMYTMISAYEPVLRCAAGSADGPQISTRRYRDYGAWDKTAGRFQRSFTFDAGAYGALAITNSTIQCLFPQQMKQFILTGSNTVESSFGGMIFSAKNGAVAASDYGWYGLVKRGTGTWALTRLYDSQPDFPSHLAGIFVEEGTLRYSSLAPTGEMCSLGRGDQNLFGHPWIGSLTNPPPTVADQVRLGCPTNAARQVVFDYFGAAEGIGTNRTIGLIGNAVLRNSGAASLAWGGVRTVLRAEDGLSSAAVLLTLDAVGTATNALGFLEEEGAALSLRKTGSGAWTIKTASFGGTLQSDAGLLSFTDASPVVSNLVIDAAVGMGEIAGVSFAAEGTLLLTNLVARETVFPQAFARCAGVSNLPSWRVCTAISDGFEYRLSFGAEGLRISRQSLVLTATNVNLVVAAPQKSGTIFAAREMTDIFREAFGAEIPTTKTPVEGMINIFLGDSPTAQAVGLDSANLPKDGYALRIDPVARRIYIVGEDTTYAGYMRDPAKHFANTHYPHATSFGVYEFLERYADCRFFFAGRLGTVVPRRTELEVPAADFVDAPDHLIRSYYYIPSAVKIPEELGVAQRAVYTHNWTRHRLESMTIPCVHGTIHFKYLNRFGESHPEYFALREDGVSRHNYYDGSSHSVHGHLCWNSAVTNEIFLDAKSYLLGEDASVRGIPGSTAGTYAWGINCKEGRYVDIMPNDAYPGCTCAVCLANRMERPQYETRTIWSATCGIAQRLLDEGIPGFVTQMSYNPYNQIPDFEIPSNVLVMVAKRGPFSICDSTSYEQQKKDIRDWSQKLGSNRVWMWNYAGKWGELAFNDIPAMCPRAWGAFYREMSPVVFGSYAESETDRWFFNHLNYYVYSKIEWNGSLRVEDILTDYYTRMYGPAADEVRSFFEDLEDIWLQEVACRMEETPLGPEARAPNEIQIWREIYTAERLSSWGETLDRGAAKLAPDSIELERLTLVRHEFLDVMTRARRSFLESISVERELRRRAVSPLERMADIIDNGDFQGTTTTRFLPRIYPDVPGGKPYSWYTSESFVPFPLTTNTFVTGGQCVVLTGLVNAAAAICQYLPSMKPNCKYRVSLFLKGENIEAASTGGAGVQFYDRYNHFYPSTARFDGTFDWIHYSFEHTTDPATQSDNPMPYLRVVLSAGCTGRLYIDGVQVVEQTNTPGFLFYLTENQK